MSRYDESSQIETVATWIGLGLLGIWFYNRSVQYGGIGNAVTSLVGQLAPVTTSSATFPPAAAPAGYYWAPNVGGGFPATAFEYRGIDRNATKRDRRP
jgi:hypothetical protein